MNFSPETFEVCDGYLIYELASENTSIREIIAVLKLLNPPKDSPSKPRSESQGKIGPVAGNSLRTQTTLLNSKNDRRESFNTSTRVPFNTGSRPAIKNGMLGAPTIKIRKEIPIKTGSMIASKNQNALDEKIVLIEEPKKPQAAETKPITLEKQDKLVIATNANLLKDYRASAIIKKDPPVLNKIPERTSNKDSTGQNKAQTAQLKPAHSVSRPKTANPVVKNGITKPNFFKPVSKTAPNSEKKNDVRGNSSTVKV